jgi:hypothetical protein
MLFSCPQIGALVAPCVGPVLTEPVSGAVPSHLAGVLVAVAEDSRLIALLAGAHSYESNPYRLPFGKSASPSSTAMLCGDAPTNLAVGVDTALDHSLAFECTQHGYQLVLCHLLSYCSLSEPYRLVGSTGASRSGSQPCSRCCCAALQRAPNSRGAAIFQIAHCHWLPSSLVRTSIAIDAGASPTNTDSMPGDGLASFLGV